MNKNAKYGILGILAAGIVVGSVAMMTDDDSDGPGMQVMPDEPVAPPVAPTDVQDTDVEPSTTGRVVDVGVLYPATGDLASYGIDSKFGLDIALSEFNSYLDAKGADWQMNLVFEDTQTDPIITLEKIQSLDSKGIKYVLGPASSAEIRNIMSYADSNDVLIVSPSSTSPKLAIPDDGIFRFVPDDRKQGSVIATLIDDMGIKALVVIYRGDIWGDGMYENTKKSFEEKGGFVADSIRYSPEIGTFSTEVNALSKTVDSLLGQYDQDEIAIFAASFDEISHMFNSATEYENLSGIQWIGSEGITGAHSVTEDMRAHDFAVATNLLSIQFSASDNEKFQDVRDSYTARYGGLPGNNYVYASYDSLWALGLTIEQVGTDPHAIKEQLPAVVEGYTGALGDIVFNDAGDLSIADYEFWTVSGGEWVPAVRYDFATGMLTKYAPAVSEISGTVDVGVLYPATGDLASYGIDSKFGLDIALSEFNSYLDAKGADWQMNLVFEDTQTDPIITLEKIQSLDSKGIKYVLGPASSAEIRNIMSYADSNDVLIVSPSSTSPKLAIPDDGIFRFVPDDRKQGSVIATLIDDMGIKALVVIYRGDIWGDGMYENTKKSFEEKGGFVADSIRYSPEIGTFSTEVNALSKTVDSLLGQYDQDEIAIFAASFDEISHMFNSATEYENLSGIQWIGSEGITGAHSVTEDMRAHDFAVATNLLSIQFSASDNEKFQDVRDSYTARYGGLPGNNYVYASYDSLWALGLTIEQVGTDPHAIKEQLPAVVEGYTGALGDIVFNDAGDLSIADYEFWTVSGGEWVPAVRYDFATGMLSSYTSP